MGNGRLWLRGCRPGQAVGTVGVGILWCLIERLCSAHPAAGVFSWDREGFFFLSSGFRIPLSLAALGFSAPFPSYKEVFWGGGGPLIFWLLIVFLAQLLLRLPSATDGLCSLGHVP